MDPNARTKSPESVSRSAAANSLARARYLAATLALAAESLHLWVVTEAFLFWPVHGAFFAVIAAGQGLLGVSLLFGPGRWAIRLGLLLNGGILAAWSIARVIGMVFPVWVIAVRTPAAWVDRVAMILVISLIVILGWIRQKSRY